MLYRRRIFVLFILKRHPTTLQEGEIHSSLYEDILKNIILPRSKQKALSLLKYMDRTEAELTRKLLESNYTIAIIEQTIKYLKEYNYINDERYTSYYVRNHMQSKSKMLIQSELLRKGIQKEFIENAFRIEYDTSPNCEDAEDIALKKALQKKTKGTDIHSYPKEEKQKIMAFLYRKGFSIEKIRRILKDFDC